MELIDTIKRNVNIACFQETKVEREKKLRKWMTINFGTQKNSRWSCRC